MKRAVRTLIGTAISVANVTINNVLMTIPNAPYLPFKKVVPNKK